MPELSPADLPWYEDIAQLHHHVLTVNEAAELALGSHVLLSAQLLDRLDVEPEERTRELQALRDTLVEIVDRWHQFTLEHPRWRAP